jgi:3-hydroxybutyryl-CoA dehydrogenase
LDGAANEADVDLAMQLGASYPQGPLAWARRLGLNRIVGILEHLQWSFGEERYRVCTLLRRWVWAPAGSVDG